MLVFVYYVSENCVVLCLFITLVSTVLSCLFITLVRTVLSSYVYYVIARCLVLRLFITLVSSVLSCVCLLRQSALSRVVFVSYVSAHCLVFNMKTLCLHAAQKS